MLERRELAHVSPTYTKPIQKPPAFVGFRSRKGPSGKEQRKSTGTCLISSSVTVSAMPVAETVTQPGHDAIQESFEPHIVKPLPLSLVYFCLLSWSSRAIMIERFNLSFRTSLLIVG